MVCRGEQHDLPYGDPKLDHWDEEYGERGRFIGWLRELECRRCGMVQRDICDRGGNLRRLTPRYPKGYRISREEFGFVGRRQARLARLYLMTAASG